MTLALVSRLSLTRGAAPLLKTLGRSSWARSMICTTFIFEGGNTLVLRSELLDVPVWMEPDGEHLLCETPRWPRERRPLAAGDRPFLQHSGAEDELHAGSN
jgi:hypothetical protein